MGGRVCWVDHILFVCCLSLGLPKGRGSIWVQAVWLRGDPWNQERESRASKGRNVDNSVCYPLLLWKGGFGSFGTCWEVLRMLPRIFHTKDRRLEPLLMGSSPWVPEGYPCSHGLPKTLGCVQTLVSSSRHGRGLWGWKWNTTGRLPELTGNLAPQLWRNQNCEGCVPGCHRPPLQSQTAKGSGKSSPTFHKGISW